MYICDNCGAEVSSFAHSCLIKDSLHCTPCAPAQEEKEIGHCTKHQMRYGQGETCLSCTADLRERWDRAFFAALTGYCANPLPGVAWEAARDVATETIRRHADMMASRDAIIAEVVG